MVVNIINNFLLLMFVYRLLTSAVEPHRAEEREK